MELSAYIDIYPEQAMLCAFAGIICFWLLIGFWGILDVINLYFITRRRVNYCEGLMRGHISGPCHNRTCPYSSQCCHYEKPKGIFRRKAKKNKPQE